MNRSAYLDLSDKIDGELAAIKLLEDYVSTLTEQAGEGEHMCIEIAFDKLSTMSSALYNSVNNIDRILKENVPVK